MSVRSTTVYEIESQALLEKSGTVQWDKHRRCLDLDSVLVNSVCQLDGAMDCSDIWTNVILGFSVRMLLDEFKI